jgi:hypothetical protein
MTPTIVLENGAPILAVGGSGGYRIAYGGHAGGGRAARVRHGSRRMRERNRATTSRAPRSCGTTRTFPRHARRSQAPRRNAEARAIPHFPPFR